MFSQVRITFYTSTNGAIVFLTFVISTAFISENRKKSNSQLFELQRAFEDWFRESLTKGTCEPGNLWVRDLWAREPVSQGTCEPGNLCAREPVSQGTCEPGNLWDRKPVSQELWNTVTWYSYKLIIFQYNKIKWIWIYVWPTHWKRDDLAAHRSCHIKSIRHKLIQKAWHLYKIFFTVGNLWYSLYRLYLMLKKKCKNCLK